MCKQWLASHKVHPVTVRNYHDTLQKKYPNPDEELPVLNNTLLNSEVSNINYNSTEGKAVVQTSNGEEYVADHVITTVSLGVLKEQYETLFTPRLPESKVKTIQVRKINDFLFKSLLRHCST